MDIVVDCEFNSICKVNVYHHGEQNALEIIFEEHSGIAGDKVTLFLNPETLNEIRHRLLNNDFHFGNGLTYGR
jgi:hypothetical protein